MIRNIPELVRFDLEIARDFASRDRACYDVRRDNPLHKAVTWTIDPETLRGLLSDDATIRYLSGGGVALREAYAAREDRRCAFVEIAGMLGSHLCDEIEKLEGWGQ